MAEDAVRTSGFALGKDQVLRCAELSEYEWLDHGFGTRLGGDAAERTVTLRQIHSDRVWEAGGLRDREEEGDALVTRTSGVRIGVRTADCIPLLIADPVHRAVAAVHAGWRGTVARIVERTVLLMQERFGSRPEQLAAAAGPCIRACCYEVSADVAVAFQPLLPELEARLTEGKVKLDLVEANRRIWRQSGARTERFYDSERCTHCEPDLFYSYRHDRAGAGRMLATICRME